MEDKKDLKKSVDEGTVLLVDESVLRKMFKGKNEERSGDLLTQMKDIKDRGAPLKAVTTLSSFLRAIFLLEPDTTVKDIQRTLSFLEIAPSFADFKNGKAVTDEVVEFAQAMSGKKKEWKIK